MAVDVWLPLLPALALVVYLVVRGIDIRPQVTSEEGEAMQEVQPQAPAQSLPLDRICADFAASGELNVARALTATPAPSPAMTGAIGSVAHQDAMQDLAQLAQSLASSDQAIEKPSPVTPNSAA